MGCELVALCVDALDPVGEARFWAGVLGRERDRDGVTVAPPDGAGFVVRFRPTSEPRTTPNVRHFDLTSTSLQEQTATVDRALALGATYLDVGQGPDAEHVVLADPEGNEFCVIEPGNRFLEGTGFVGAVSCDGSQEVGYFWAAALGWPLVWDQDQETAIQSPRGGTKVTWGGPPYTPKQGRARWCFDLVPAADSDRAREVERLVALGATVLTSDDGATELADPDGHELRVVDAR